MKTEEIYQSNYFNIANSLFYLNKEILENSLALMKANSFNKDIYKFIHEADALIIFHSTIMESLNKNNNFDKSILKNLNEEHNISKNNFQKMFSLDNINLITN